MFFSRRGRAAEVTVAADDYDEYEDGGSTATGAPPLEPEAGDWNDAADLKKKTGKKTRGGRRGGGPASTLRCFEACGATISTFRRETKPMRFLLDENSAAARRGQGLLAQVRLLFFHPCCLGTPPFSSKMRGAHVATAGRRRAQFYSLFPETQHYC